MRITAKLSVVLFALLAGVSGAGANPQSERNSDAVPILVELFTSEGCSSCPPADAWLQRLDAAQPIPGAQLIVLSQHVDYWNRAGWADPFSSPISTARQIGYVRALGKQSPYTPQIIVNGTDEIQRGDTQKVDQTFASAAREPRIPVHIVSATTQPRDPASIRARIEIDGISTQRSADVYAVVALGHAESEVRSGENKGKRLLHVAVMQSLTRVGKLEKAKKFTREFQVMLKPGTDPQNVRLIVIVQEAGPGKVLGAALRDGIQ